MLYALATIVVLGVAQGTAMSADPTFEPGCSFYGGQCAYSIKLGHANQCDNPPSTATTTSGSNGCCDELSSKYTKLKDDMDALKTKVDVMTTMITDSSKNMSGLETELQKALAARDDIVMVLNRKESELNSTKAELAKVMAKASEEIQNLRNNLTSVQNSFSTCQAALGGVDSTSTNANTGAQAGDYTMTYYNFNQNTPDFTFAQTSNGHLKMALLRHGSGTSTGPKTEHSWGVNKGSYLGLDAHEIASKIYNSHTTILQAESISFPPANAYCIMFWYYMEGRDVKTLTVNLKINGGNGYPVYSKSGPMSTHRWNLAQVYLGSEYTQHQFQIDVTMSSIAHYTYTGSHQYSQNADGDIALDDLYVFNTTCSSIPRHPQGHSFYGANNATSFYTFHLTPMTWTEAYDVCRREGPWTGLVSIETNAEQLALVSMIRSNPAYDIVGGKGFYTSGTDADSEHNFVWTNTGVQRAITFSNWHIGQPNNVAGNQDCLLMEYPHDEFRWGDVDCATKHPFICETEVPGKAN